MTALSHRLPLVLAALALVAGCGRGVETPQATTFPQAPVIVISIDTLRADHLPAWGYRGLKTPNIDRLRDDGVLFRNAYSQVPLTLPSHVSLFTGQLPADHGVRDNIGYRLGATTSTLPQTLKKNGYATGAAVSSYVLRGTTGLRPLFDWYDDPIAFAAGADLGAIQRPGAATAAAAQRWIASQSTAPFFLFMHLFEPHTPYDPPEPYRSAASTAYDGEIAHADAILGGFLDDLRARGIYDRSIVILLSDHGEGLNDHGEPEHGIFVYREAIHVPLIVKLPKNASAGTTIDEPVGLIDIYPTVVALTGGDAPAQIAGVPIIGPGAKREPARRIFSESLYARLHLGWSDVRSLIDGQQHYIDAPRAELYTLANDPGEQKNVLADERRAAASFRTAIAQFEKKLTAPGAASPEEMAKLAALGYISAPASSVAANLPDAKDHIAQYGAYMSARASVARGDMTAAIRELRDVLAQNPNFTDASLELARAYETTRQFTEAAEVYRGVLARNPALTEQVAIGVATSLMNAGRLDEARAHAELALTANPAAAHLLLGRIALAARTPAVAEKHAREAARDAHYEPQAVLLLSDALLAGGAVRAPEALRALDALKSARASRGEPPVRSLEVARASALMQMSRPSEAIEALRTETRVHPQNREAYARLAAIHLLQKDVASGEAVLVEMVRANPGPAANTLAANTLAHFGYRDAAENWLRRAGARPQGVP
ncbi:MAG TPA: sulfatase-like hydrolase/transferase [Thermoanaerobaculia bacterium]|jgi:arylsulfatase A-like enzyme